MEAEQDAERLLRRTEKRAFAAFKISFVLVLANKLNINWAILVNYTEYHYICK